MASPCTETASDDERLACFDALQRCAAVVEDTVRLECFDRAFAEAAPAPFEPAAGKDALPETMAATPEEFAEKKSRKEKKREDDRKGELAGTIAAVQTNAVGIDFIRLENGQVWRETEDSRVNLAAGQDVVIKKGIFGSFSLRVDGDERIVKVRRVE